MDAGYLVVFVGVVATLATGYAYFRSSAVKVWEQNSAAYQARVKLLEEANETLKKQITWMEHRIQELEAKPDWTQVVALMQVSEQHIIDAIQAMRTEQSQQHQSALNEVTAQVAERVRVAERERVIDNG